MTKAIHAGALTIGGGAPISVQSMTNTDTRDVEKTLEQIQALYHAGCDIVRVSVYDEACAEAVRQLVDKTPVPLVADIHFDYRLALKSMENGIHKLRINPGNIGGQDRVRMVADCAKAHGVPIRIGVNSGSVEKGLLARYGGPTPEAMVESALNHARLLEECGFYDIAISVKASDVRGTVQANRILHEKCEYPLHIGVTEAGLGDSGLVKSAIGIGALLMDGIGDTIRVSLSGDPLQEPEAGKKILRALGLKQGVDVVACPTCGRTCIDVAGIAAQVEEAAKDIHVPMKVAVMGCVVNGPGEASEADVGVAGAPEGFALFVRGEKPRKAVGDPAKVLLEEIRRIADIKGKK